LGNDDLSSQVGQQQNLSAGEGVCATKYMFTKPVDNPILATPKLLERDIDQDSTTIQQTKRRSTRLAKRPNSDLPVEQQATALLMKKCGLLQHNQKPSQAAREQFQTQFVNPMVDETIRSYRETFDLPMEEGTDSLSALVIHAEA